MLVQSEKGDQEYGLISEFCVTFHSKVSERISLETFETQPENAFTTVTSILHAGVLDPADIARDFDEMELKIWVSVGSV